MRYAIFRCAALLLAAFIVVQSSLQGQDPAGPQAKDGQLLFVVYLSRHGVRSPTGDPGRYDAYSSAPWPKWSVRPGYLTEHGFALMKLFGAYDRIRFAQEGLIAPDGCADTSRVKFLADSDERTRETAKALAEGMFPGCQVTEDARPEGEFDPLFHSLRAGVGKPDRALVLAAIEGRMGGDADNLTAVYRPQLEALDRILGGCGRAAATNPTRTSIFDVPPMQTKGRESRTAKLRGPVAIGSSMAETLLLEYAEGMKGSGLGWGCLNEDKLREIMQLHTAHADYTDRTPMIARMDASNLLDRILSALEQSAEGKMIPGAPGNPSDRVLFLVGHDTNIAAVAGMLGLDWIVDGRSDDTPPGGALVFELWRTPSGTYSVRVSFTSQTLRQMRETQTLTPANPPQLVPVFVPGCSRTDMSCTLDGFARTARHAIDPAFVGGH